MANYKEEEWLINLPLYAICNIGTIGNIGTLGNPPGAERSAPYD
jgi:hypothetical protein